MSDHGSGPRAFADPVVDITDMYVFPCPSRPGTLVLIMNTFAFAGPSAVFSDALDYRFRIRPVQITGRGAGAAFAVADQEFSLRCRFPAASDSGGGKIVQQGVCTTSTGKSVSFTVNDERGGGSDALRVFAGRRMDPFFFDGVRAAQTVVSRKLSFAEVGTSTVAHQNVMSIVVEIAIDSMLPPGTGPLLAVVSETATLGTPSMRFERFGRPEIKNLLLFAKMYDQVNRDLEIRDIYNQEDAFHLGAAYDGAYRARLNANLAFWDGLDGETAWPLDEHGGHPLTDLLLADFMVVDTSKPFSENGSYEIEVATVAGDEHRTCGGRAPNEDAVETMLTWLVNGCRGPRIGDGVDAPAVPATATFPYLVPPELNPPPVKPPPIDSTKK